MRNAKQKKLTVKQNEMIPHTKVTCYISYADFVSSRNINLLHLASKILEQKRSTTTQSDDEVATCFNN